MSYRTARSLALLIVFAVVTLVSLRLSLDVQAANTLTYPGASAPCNTTLQGCIDAAVDGDTVEVSAGVYVTDSLAISNAITLRGAGPSATILQAKPGQRLIYVNLGIITGVVIADLTVLGGNVISGAGGGIYSDSNTPLTLRNVHVLSNTAGFSGGGLFSDGTLTLFDALFQHNSSASQGGGLYTSSMSVISGTEFIDNSAASDGGGAYGSDSFSAVNSTFVKNSSDMSGGGVYAAGDLTLSATQFIGNEALESGGGAYAGIVMHLDGATFISNTAQADGGGAFVTNWAAVTKSQFFSDTTGPAGIGGALFVQHVGSDASTISSSLFAVNRDGGTAADVYFMPAGGNTGSAEISYSTFADPGLAAGAAIASGSGTLSVIDSIIASHTIGIAQLGDSAVTQDFNLLAENTTDISGTVDGGANNAAGTPSFVAPQTGNYRLTILSAALDHAPIAQCPLSNDLDGLPRPNPAGGLCDYGAFEFQHQPPTADLGGPYSGPQGSPIVLNASGSSGESPIAAYSFKCTDVSSVQVRASAVYTCTYSQVGNFNAHVTITDSVGLTDTASAAVAVSNVAPNVSPPSNQQAEQGVQKSFVLGTFTDPGASDNPWQVAVDWGDSNPDTSFAVNAVGALPERQHTYTLAGSHTVTVTVTDKNGGFNSATFQVAVSNVGPIVTPPSHEQSAVQNVSRPKT